METNRNIGIIEGLAWVSVFFEAWLLLLQKIPSNFTSWAFWGFFLLVAVLSALVRVAEKR